MATFNINTPAGTDVPSVIDDRIREIKAAVQERENVDHYWPLDAGQVSDPDKGEHRKVTLRVGSAPTEADDKGILYAKDVGDPAKAELFYRDEDGDEIQITTGGIIKLTSAALLGILANNTYLTAVDLEGTGTVELIKAARNVANDADVVQFPDKARLFSNAAPGEDTELANKKYVDDQIATLIFGTRTNKDSGGSLALVINSIYKVGSDGFITAFITIDADANRTISGYTDNNTTPTTLVILNSVARLDNTRPSISFPVRKDDYFKITTTNNAAATIYWLPIGTGTSVKQ